MSIVVQPVKSGSERKTFLNLPWRLYADDPNWIPPLRMNQKELVGYKKHPFYETAEIQTFLAMRDGKPCGRIAAIVNHAHNQRFGEKRGFFGFFESIDDQQVANELFESAGMWLADHGMTAIRGPMNPSINYEIGLLVEGFDSPPKFMMTYNPPFYRTLIEEYGFEKSQDLFAYSGHVAMIEKLGKKIEFVVEELTRRFELTVRRIDRKRFKEDVRSFLDIYNQASAGMWGFVPMSAAEVEHTASALRFLIAPEMTTFIEVDGRPVGALFGMLDYNPRIKKIDGRLFPLGFLRLLWNRRAIKCTRLVATEVLPEFQKWGLGVVLLSRLIPDGIAWGITEVEFSWVAESNTLSRRSLERGGAKRTKTYRIYDREI